MKKKLWIVLTVIPLAVLLVTVPWLLFVNGNVDLKKSSEEAYAEKSLEVETIEDLKVPDVTGDVAPGIGAVEETKKAVEEDAFEEYDITMMAVGDNLMHMGIVHTGKQLDGTYNYDMLFRNITEILDSTDIKIINQETILGGNQFGFSGFPAFNSPTEVGDAIAKAGFNVVLSATNHAADMKIAGIENSIHYWETHPDILFVGTTLEENDDTIPILTIKDKTFAILNYTYGPNMETIPASIKGHLKMLCAYDEKSGLIQFTELNPQVPEEIRRAKEMADVVIVCPHWGTEYQSNASSFQKKWAVEMADAGADVIIGTHPHVPQPVEWIETENGGKALCFYSLGNYVSTQKQSLCMLEGMAYVVFHVTEDGISVALERSGVVPLVCHYTSEPVRFENVYFLEDYTEEQALKHGIWNYGGVPLHLEDLQKWSLEIFGDYAINKKDILNQQDTLDEQMTDGQCTSSGDWQ